MLRPSLRIGTSALLFAAALSACGGEDAQQEDRCGPGGELHLAVGAEPHCDCFEGFSPVDGTCVDNSTLPPPDKPEPPVATGPDCGANGTFDGRQCACDPGYTQTGISDARTCEQIPVCQGGDDAHEPNNRPSAGGSPMDAGQLYACPADEDWYIFPVTAGDNVFVEITFDNASVDLDLFRFGPSSQNPRAFSFSSSNNYEQATFQARADGQAGILVSPYGIGEGVYEITMSVTAGEAPMCNPPGGACSGGGDCCSNSCHVGHCH